jgi:hypothetical protein
MSTGPRLGNRNLRGRQSVREHPATNVITSITAKIRLVRLTLASSRL